MNEVNAGNSTKIRISFGGGIGGCSEVFSFCRKVKITGNVISFDGYRNIPDSERVLLFLDPPMEEIYVLDISHWPANRIANLRNCMRMNDISMAKQEYTACQPDNKIKIVKLEKVKVCGNWYMSEGKT